MGIHIGNNNSIHNSNIIEKGNIENNPNNKNSFFDRHPILISLIISLIVGFLLMFSFWDAIISWIEGLF